jgi:hypothetical protein
VLLCGKLLELLLAGSELHLPVLVRGRLPVLVGARLLLLFQQPADIGLRLVMLLLLRLLLVAVVLRLLVGGRPMPLVLASTRPQLGMLVLLVLLQRVLLMMLSHVLVLVGDRRLLSQLGDNELLLVGPLLLLPVVLLVLW